MIDLPAPVSPVRTEKPASKESSSSEMMAKSLITSVVSMRFFFVRNDPLPETDAVRPITTCGDSSNFCMVK